MKQHLLRYSLLGLSLVCGGSVFAQADIPFILTAKPKNTFSASLRFKAGGAAVSFSNLGSIERPDSRLRNAAGTIVQYQFDDGAVLVETAERPEAADQTNLDRGLIKFSADGKRYQVFRAITKTENGQQVFDKAGRLEADRLAYQAGQTRYWTYTYENQAANGFIEMHNYGARTQGAGFDADSGTGAGFDLQFTREIGRIGKRGEWGFAASIGIVDLNAKTSGKVTSTLLTQVSRFSLMGQAAPAAPYSAPPQDVPGPQMLDEDGKPVTTVDPKDSTQQVPVYTLYEPTVPLQSTPTSVTDFETPNGTEIDGRWQLKGSYYSIRVGPSFRYQFARRLSVVATAGFSTAYIGSTYRVTETLYNPVAPTSALRTLEAERRQSDVIFGGYGEINAEFWLSYRTGIFAGVVYEKLGKYEQSFGGRNARVNIGDGASFRIGIVTRF
jgi:hypothetical protein